MEKGHDAESDIFAAQPVVIGDMARRADQAGVFQRHSLGPSGASTRVQQKGDVARTRLRQGSSFLCVTEAYPTIVPHADGEYWNVFFLSRLSCLFGTILGTEDHARLC